MRTIGVAVLIAVCMTPAARAADLLSGTWQYAEHRHALRLMFTADYSYQVDWNNDGRTDINGIYEFWDGRVIFRDEYPAEATDCTAPGVYYPVLENDRLTFTLYSDDCRPRRATLQEDFVRTAD